MIGIYLLTSTSRYILILGGSSNEDKLLDLVLTWAVPITINIIDKFTNK